MKIFIFLFIFFCFSLLYSYDISINSDDLIEINVLSKKYYVNFLKTEKKFEIYDELY